jgi:hypothetical protein
MADFLTTSAKPFRVTPLKMRIAPIVGRGALGVYGCSTASEVPTEREARRRDRGRRVMRVIVVLLSLAGAREAGAQAPGIATSAGIAAVGDAAIALDWRTTVIILRQGAVETNWVLGPRPNTDALLVYNLAALAAYTVGSIELPKPWRYLMAIGVVGLESACVAMNLRWQSADGH